MPKDRTGFLQKHKDYVKRATVEHHKEAKLKFLQKQAEFRNPDEYNSSMKRAAVDENGNIVLDEIPVTNEKLRKMESQDINYLYLKRNQESNKLEKLQAELQCLPAAQLKEREGSHTIFVGTEAEQSKFSPQKYFDTAPRLLRRAYNRPRIQTLCDTKPVLRPETLHNEMRAFNKRRQKSYIEYEARLQRRKAMTKILSTLQQRKNLVGGGRVRRIVKLDKFGDVDPKLTQYRWKQVRKK